MKMPPQPSSDQSLRAEGAAPRARLEKAEAMLRPIRAGEADALVVEGGAGPQIMTLQGLDAEQSRLRAEMLAQVSDAVIAVDNKERITFLNAAAERQYSVRAGEVLGRTLTEMFTPHWLGPETEAGMRTSLSEHGEWRGELVHRRQDGSELHVETSATALHDPDGAATGYIASIRDITERHQAETALRRNTALFSKIIEQAPGGVYVVDGQFRLMQMNAESLPFFASAQPLIGRDFDQVLEIVWGPDIGAQCARIFRHTLATGERYISPRFSELRHDTGEKQAFEWETQRITLPDGQHGVVCYFQDVTERERAEAAQREIQERLTLAVKCSQVVLFQQDLDLRYTWLQNAVPGFDDSVTIGKRDADLMERATDAAVTEALKREVIRTGVSQGREVLVQIAGVDRHYDLLVEPQRNAAGLICGVTCAAIDITERKRSEKVRHEMERHYRALSAASSEVAYRMSADWSTMLPLDGDRLPASSDQPCADWAWLHQNVPHDEQPRVRQAISDAIARKTLFELEHRVRRPDGSTGWTLSRAVPVVDENNDVTEWFGAASDITERKATEEALRESGVLLAAIDRRKDEFLATLSHELRNPLGVIASSLHLLRLMDQDRVAVQQGCARMQQQVVLLTRLIDDLMDVTRVKQDKLTLLMERLDLGAVIQSAVENSRTVLDQRGHSVTIQRPPQPITVNGDATRLAQAVGNLLTNAAKYSDPGSLIKLTVELQGDEAIVAVRDRGIGIAPGDLRRVFELFAQIGGAAHLARGGLGIGLNLVQRVVELHGGTVEARSDGLGHGSDFLVRLPRVAGGARTESPPERGVVSSPPSQRYRILVADDNEDALTALAALLSLEGHAVRTAKDGAQAAAIAAIFQPEVAVLDIGMPELDGIEACRRIRSRPGGDAMIIVAVSGWGQDEDKRRARDAGFNHHFVKPVDPSALTALLQSLAPTGSASAFGCTVTNESTCGLLPRVQNDK